MPRYAFILLFALFASVAHADSTGLGLRVPPGFEVTEFAGSNLADNIFSMTIDPQGRVVVSGPGYIRILVDTHHQGRADRAIIFARGPRQGAQGLLWEKGWLYFTGDGGLRRYRVERAGDRAAGPAELLLSLHTGGEHTAHAIRRGPDGWLYLLCGNFAGVDARCASLATSPIRQPLAGAVIRFRPDLHRSEIVADGFRNPYDMDFSTSGDLFTFDSDNERCVALPWYEPTRFYQVLPGGHYGWRAPQRGEWWRLPPYLPDVVEPVATFGRGSPTGVACYRHQQFPAHYRGGFFLADWTFGRIYFAGLQSAGSSWKCHAEVFLEAVGDNGFAPTALAVQPQTGDLYVAIGGRGTRGAVYRIHYAGSKPAAHARPIAIRPCPLDWQPELHERLLRQARAADAHERRRALELLCRHAPHFGPAELEGAIRGNWGDPDRYIRQAVARLIGSRGRDEGKRLLRQARAPLESATAAFGLFQAGDCQVGDTALAILAVPHASTTARLAGVRLVQLALGGITNPKARGVVWEGYSARGGIKDPALVQRASAQLRSLFPSGVSELDREVTRTLAMIQDPAPDLPARIVGQLTASSDPLADLHALIVLARLPGPYPASLSARLAAGLLNLERKLDARHISRDRNWPLRVRETCTELLRKAPALASALVAHPDFGGPEHALFALLPGMDRQQAAQRFLERAARTPDYGWTPEVVNVLASLPDERAAAALRPLWEHAELDDAILPVLCRRPRLIDRERFVQGLTGPGPAKIRLCLAALERLPAPPSADYPALIRCLRRLPAGKDGEQLHHRLVHDLEHWTGQSGLGEKPAAWASWLVQHYPKVAPQLDETGGVNLSQWRQRLARLHWSAGAAGRGHTVFVRARCASCHSGAEAMGPDLRGVASRFSRADLFAAILLPSRDISSRYQTLLIETHGGKTYQGLVVYESTDGLLLQTAPGTTVRLRGSEIATRQFTNVSMMPAGLLDKLTDAELADLYAYLRALGSSPPKKP